MSSLGLPLGLRVNYVFVPRLRTLLPPRKCLIYTFDLFWGLERLINFKYKKNGFTKEYKRKIKPIGFRTIKKGTR